MEAAIDRVMKTYGMMVHLTQGQEQTVRGKTLEVSAGLAENGRAEARDLRDPRRRPLDHF
jgi:hypothetical protein